KNGDGQINEDLANPSSSADEWYGNAPGVAETVPSPPDPMWSTTIDQRLRAARISLVVGTTNQFSGASATPPALEDRTSYPALSATYAPKFRALRMTVLPRMWNLQE